MNKNIKKTLENKINEIRSKVKEVIKEEKKKGEMSKCFEKLPAK
jgi:hypothetical protein